MKATDLDVSHADARGYGDYGDGKRRPVAVKHPDGYHATVVEECNCPYCDGKRWAAAGERMRARKALQDAK